MLRQRDLEALAHDQRLEGIGLAMFDMMGITDPLLPRSWLPGQSLLAPDVVEGKE